jgi:hypothetical protein
MTQQQGGRDEDAPGGVTDTGDGTGGSLGTGTGSASAAGKSGGGTTGGVTDTGDGTGGSLGTGTTGDRGAGAAEPRKGSQGQGASDKMVKGMSEAGKHPDEPLKR